MLNLSQNRLSTVQRLSSLPALVALNLGESHGPDMHPIISTRSGGDAYSIPTSISLTVITLLVITE